MSTTEPDSLLNYKESEIDTLPVAKLKELITNAGASYAGCFEKSEFITLAKKVRVNVVPHHNNSALVKPDHESVREVKIDYYELLGVSKTATTNEITKAYYKLAKEYHPDKNRNDAYAEEMFKKVSEAYQVLTDPDKRKRYDQFGMDAMSEMNIDPIEIFRMIFGGGLFQDYFGDLSFYDTFTNYMGDNSDPEKVPEMDSKKMDENRKERINSLSKKLEIIIEPYVHGGRKDFESMVKEKAKEMSAAPGGAELLELLGYVYVQEAKQHSVFGFIHEISEKGHKAKEIFSTISSAANMQRTMSNAEDPTQATQPQQENMLKEGLKLIWKLGRLDIDSAVRDVCEKVLDKKAPHRKQRIEAVKLLGKIFEDIGKQSLKANGNIDIFSLHSPPQQSPPQQSPPSHTTTTTSSTSPK